jgi:hypothetical protein
MSARPIARRAVILSASALLLPAAHGFAQGPREVRRAPRFEGATIPDPPRQHEPWQPPETKLPRFLIDASATLFEDGLADPRNCDYRAIEIGIGIVTRTDGWVLPAREGEKTRFAVAWNGLVYPAVSIGESIGVEADVNVIAQEDRVAREAHAKRPMVHVGFRSGTNALWSASPTSLNAIKVCLLLRLGRADLAETVWAAGTEGREMLRDDVFQAATANPDLASHGISYVSLANDLAWDLFDRALGAHTCGDDALALADARKLTAVQKAVETRSKAMGFDPRSPTDRADEAVPYIRFLGQLPELLADHERRARALKRPPVPLPGFDKRARIAALIAELDQVAVRQWGQPGGVNLGESPVVRALIAEGDDAVGPLIEDLERDTRLTRSVQFWRDFHRSRTIMGAHEAAYAALCGILHTSFFGAATTGDNLTARGLEGRKAVADRIRAYWEKNRGIPLVERWYRTLADDHAAPGEWLQAAGNIVQHENVSVVPSSTAFTTTVTSQLPPGARPRLRGEALRGKRNPSVVELMATRVNDIDPGPRLHADSGDQFKVVSANAMAEMLAEWDNKAALPVLQARVERCARIVQAGQQAGRRFHGTEAAIAGLTNLRIRARDLEALADYGGRVRTVTPDNPDLAFAVFEMFEPLWRSPDHPAVIAAAAALFEDPKSPWNPSLNLRELEMNRGFRLELLGSPLLGLKSFRTVVLRALADMTQVGTVEVDAEGRMTVIQGVHKTVVDGNLTTHYSGNRSREIPGGGESPFKPGPNALPLRVADVVREQLEQVEGIPRFRKQWPLAKRDEAIAATIAYLKHYGERFRDNEASRALRAAEPGGPSYEKAILAFDPLDQPATAAEVAAGRAIFSLVGAGTEVRRVPLPSLPLAARWTKLEVFPDDPPIRRARDALGHDVPDIEALQTGRVWQAEEVREGERWRRYYGFAGRHALTRVRAEEVEFPLSWVWFLLSTDLDARIVINEPAPTTGPLPVELWLRNHLGVETTAPTDLVRETGRALSLREGIAFRLVRESDRPVWANTIAALEGASEKPFAPEEIAARPVGRHSGGASPRTMAAAERLRAFELDLRTLFRIDQPGRYRLEITFDDLNSRGGKPANVATVFLVGARKTE